MLTLKMAVTTNDARVILVVDDETAVRSLVCSILSRRGHTVLEAKDGSRALEIVKQCGTAIDVLLTDLVMPGMNGRDLLRNLEAFAPLLSVVLMSGYTQEAIAARGILVDCQSVLRKPFSAQELILEVEGSLGTAPDTA